VRCASIASAPPSTRDVPSREAAYRARGAEFPQTRDENVFERRRFGVDGCHADGRCRERSPDYPFAISRVVYEHIDAVAVRLHVNVPVLRFLQRPFGGRDVRSANLESPAVQAGFEFRWSTKVADRAVVSSATR